MRSILTSLSLVLSICSFAQERDIYFFTNETKAVFTNFIPALKQEDKWRPYERKIDELIEKMDKGLTANSGMSFNDMNTLRSFKSFLNKIKNFGDGIAAGAYNKAFNGKMLREIQEIMPEIKFESLTQTDCIKFYRVSVGGYVALVARHNTKKELKKIDYWDYSKRCRTLGGDFTVTPGLYTKFWDNSECPSYNGEGIVMQKCAFVKYWDYEDFQSIKPFED